MDAIYYLFAAALAVIAIQAAIAIWTPRKTAIRAAAVVTTIAFMPLAYVTLAELLSRPKPISMEWFERNSERATVLGASLDEGKAIYLWLLLEGSRKPRFYVLPWQQQTAEQLEDTLESVIRNRGSVVLNKPFTKRSNTERGSLSIEIKPPPTLPLKPPQLPPRIFNPRGQQI